LETNRAIVSKLENDLLHTIEAERSARLLIEQATLREQEINKQHATAITFRDQQLKDIQSCEQLKMSELQQRLDDKSQLISELEDENEELHTNLESL
jgi:hypothetical protein